MVRDNPSFPSPVPFVDFERIHRSISSQLTDAFTNSLAMSDFVLGEAVSDFETQFSDYLGGNTHVVGVANGTDAIEIALRSLQLPYGSEVLVPSNSFIASATGVVRAGLVPRFVEPDFETLLVDGEGFRKAITRKTSAVLAVHLFGNVANILGLLEYARDRKIAVIEDAAQAHGALLHGNHVGTLADVAATSFYPGKNLGALGDGGAVITNSPEVAERARLLRNFGSKSKYNHETFGFNSRLDAVQARMLSVKLPHLESWNEDRRRLARNYYSFFESQRIYHVPKLTAGSVSVHHLFPILLDRRDELGVHLRNHQIDFGLHYPKSIPQLPPFSGMKSSKRGFLLSRKIADSILSLPIFPGMRDNEQSQVIEALVDFSKGKGGLD